MFVGRCGVAVESKLHNAGGIEGRQLVNQLDGGGAWRGRANVVEVSNWTLSPPHRPLPVELRLFLSEDGFVGDGREWRGLF